MDLFREKMSVIGKRWIKVGLSHSTTILQNIREHARNFVPVA